MSGIHWITRITLALALVAALLAVTPAPAAADGPRTDQAAFEADDAGSSPSWSPWRLLESVLRSISAADEGSGEEESEGGETGGSEDPVTGGPANEDPGPPACPAQQSGGPCADPEG